MRRVGSSSIFEKKGHALPPSPKGRLIQMSGAIAPRVTWSDWLGRPIVGSCAGFPVYTFHIWKLGRIVMNPDIYVVE
jgi:hypothetical protein